MSITTGQRVTRKGRSLYAKLKTTTMTLTTPSGTFQYGETVTGGTSSATGVVVYWNATDSELQVANVVGTFQASETVTGGTSSASGTTSTAPAVAWATSWTLVDGITDGYNPSEQRNAKAIVDSGTPEQDYEDQIFGNKTASGQFTMALIPSGTAYQLHEASNDFVLQLCHKHVQTDRDAANTRTVYRTGVANNANEQNPVEDESTVQYTVTYQARSLTDPT